MKKFTKLMSLVLAIFCISLCFAGCEIGSSKTLESINVVSGTIKTTYNVGEQLDLNGAKLTLTYSDDSQAELNLVASMVSGFDSTTAGAKTLTITYKGKTATVNYTVTSNLLDVSFTGVYKSRYAENNMYVYICFVNNNGVYEVYMVASASNLTRTQVLIQAEKTAFTKALFDNKWQYSLEVLNPDQTLHHKIIIDDITENSLTMSQYDATTQSIGFSAICDLV